MKLFRYMSYVIFAIIAALVSLLLLAHWRLSLDTVEATLMVEHLNEYRNGDIALVGLQTELHQRHYQNAERLEFALDQWLGQLRVSLPQHQTVVVVLPEHIGTWLVAADETWLTYLLPSTSFAFAFPLLRQPQAYYHH